MSKGWKLIDFVEATIPKLNDGLDELRLKLSETYYYIADVSRYLQTWFGVRDKPLVIVNASLKGKVRLESKAIVVYVKGKRKFRFNWETLISEATLEQAIADTFSYDPEWESYIPDVLWNASRIDFDEALSLASKTGRERLATLLALYMTFTGKTLQLETNPFLLSNEKLVDKLITASAPFLFDERIIAKKNL